MAARWGLGLASALAVGCGGGDGRAAPVDERTGDGATVTSTGAEETETRSENGTPRVAVPDTPDEPAQPVEPVATAAEEDDGEPPRTHPAPDVRVTLTLTEGPTEPTARCAPSRHAGWTGSPECARRGRPWARIPTEHGRCVTSADCAVVVAGHCRHMALSAEAAASERYAAPACGAPNEGACMPGWNDDDHRPEAICLHGCCTLHSTRGGRRRKALVREALTWRVEAAVRPCLDEADAPPSPGVPWVVDLTYGGGATTVLASEGGPTPELFVRCLGESLPPRLPPNVVGDRWDVRIVVAPEGRHAE